MIAAPLRRGKISAAVLALAGLVAACGRTRHELPGCDPRIRGRRRRRLGRPARHFQAGGPTVYATEPLPFSAQLQRALRFVRRSL